MREAVPPAWLKRFLLPSCSFPSSAPRPLFVVKRMDVRTSFSSANGGYRPDRQRDREKEVKETGKIVLAFGSTVCPPPAAQDSLTESVCISLTSSTWTLVHLSVTLRHANEFLYRRLSTCLQICCISSYVFLPSTFFSPTFHLYKHGTTFPLPYWQYDPCDYSSSLLQHGKAVSFPSVAVDKRDKRKTAIRMALSENTWDGT